MHSTETYRHQILLTTNSHLQPTSVWLRHYRKLFSSLFLCLMWWRRCCFYKVSQSKFSTLASRHIHATTTLVLSRFEAGLYFWTELSPAHALTCDRSWSTLTSPSPWIWTSQRSSRASCDVVPVLLNDARASFCGTVSHFLRRIFGHLPMIIPNLRRIFHRTLINQRQLLLSMYWFVFLRLMETSNFWCRLQCNKSFISQHDVVWDKRRLNNWLINLV